LVAPSVDAFGTASGDLKKRTNCQRCGSGNLDHAGIFFLTTPFVNNQNSVPGAAFCTSETRRLGPFLPPFASSP
jgi:hypothetical protein